MKTEKDLSQDIANIRTMMERSSKFLLLSGWAGIMAGIYALAGAFIAYNYFEFKTVEASVANGNILILALAILTLAVGTTIFLASKKAESRGEKLWNPTASRVVSSMAVPLATGAILIFILFSKGIFEFAAPLTLIFYGISLFSASRYTYSELGSLGIIQILLGLLSSYFTQNALLFWAFGFGIMHIVYGVFMHYKYER